MQKVVFNSKEAAEYCCVTERFLASRRYSGGGPNFLRLGRWIRYRKVDLDEWLDKFPPFQSTSEESASGKR